MHTTSRHIIIWLLLTAACFFTVNAHSQTANSGGVKFKFYCDSLQTLILAERTIQIYILDEKKKNLISTGAYCTSKFFELEPGNYSVIIESPKFCTEEVNMLVINPEKLEFIELNLKREQDPDCTNERNFKPPKSFSCG